MFGVAVRILWVGGEDKRKRALGGLLLLINIPAAHTVPTHTHPAFRLWTVSDQIWQQCVWVTCEGPAPTGRPGISRYGGLEEEECQLASYAQNLSKPRCFLFSKLVLMCSLSPAPTQPSLTVVLRVPCRREGGREGGTCTTITVLAQQCKQDTAGTAPTYPVYWKDGRQLELQPK